MIKTSPDLVGLVQLVKGLIEGLPDYNWQHPDAYRRAEQAAVERLRAEGARITDGSNGVSITFGRVRSASTGGTSSALKNWMAAARRKLDQQAIERMSGS